MSATEASWPGPSPSDPACPLVELLEPALAAPRPEVAPVEWRPWLLGSGLQPDLVHLCCLLLGIGLAPSPWNARFFVVERQQGYEPCPAWFHATFVPCGDRREGSVVAHPARMLAVSIQYSFRRAVERAREQAVAEGLLSPSLDVVWWVRVARRKHVPSLAGSSVGLAAGVVMAGGSGNRQGPPPPGHWVFAGSVGAFGGEDMADPDLLDLLYDDTDHPAADELLIVPAGDLLEFRGSYRDPQRIRGVGSLSEALMLASSPVARSRLLMPFNDPDPRLVPRSCLRQLEQAALQAAEGGATVLVLGESGTGKGPLIDQLRRLLAADGWMIGRHRCDSYRRGRRVFAPFRELLRQLECSLRREGESATASDLAALRSVLEAPVDGTSSSPRFRPRRGSIGRRFLERTAETFVALAQSRRIALLLDDLHWADETSVALFLHLALKVCAGGSNMLLVGGLRPGDLEGRLGRQELPSTLRELSAAACPQRFSVVDFAALSSKDQEELIRNALAIRGCLDPDPALIALLHQHAGVNMFSLQLTVNWLHGTGKLEIGRGRWALRGADATDVPDVDEIIDWFAAGLGPDREDVLRRAAVIGREFRLDLLHETIDKSPGKDRLATWLDESELVQIVPTSDTRLRLYEFVHARVAARLRDSLVPDVTRAAHREVALAYEALAKSGITHQARSHEEVCHLLAIHWGYAGHPDRAAVHWEHLATKDRQLGAYDTALWDLTHELDCREAHTPAQEADRAAWWLSTARAHVDRAGIYRLRDRDGDLARAAVAVDHAWGALDDVRGTKPLSAPERILDELPGNLGASWLLHAARAQAEAGEIARLSPGADQVDQAQAHLEAAIDRAEWLRARGGAENAELRQDAGRVLAKAGCTLMSLYLARALRYQKYEPYAEGARRAQEARVMHLGTRLLALSRDLTPEERTEVSVMVLRTQGNVFFWLEGQAQLARQHYRDALALLQTQESSVSRVGARVGDADHDVSDCLASLRLAHADLGGARDHLDRYRMWAENVGAREHLVTVAYKQALIEVVGATAHADRRMTGSLDDAARLLDMAIDAPRASFPELKLRALLLRRWVAARRDGDDPALFDGDLRLEQQHVWSGVPDELASDPEAHLLCDVMMDAPWWVVEQCDHRRPAQLAVPPAQLAVPLAAALARHGEFVYDDGRELDLANEVRARVRARVSRRLFRERMQPVADQVERLCAIHFPGDTATARILRCAAWAHDCLHDASDAELEQLIEDWTVEAEPLEHAYPWWLHGRLGYELLQRELAQRLEWERARFKDELRSAIEYHIWPGLGMSRPSSVFYVATQLVALDATLKTLRDQTNALGDRSAEAESNRIWRALRLRSAQQTRDRVDRFAGDPATLDQALQSALAWDLARRRALGQAIHPRSIMLMSQGAPKDSSMSPGRAGAAR
jgi:HD superfamily phosphohydrolase YqeK